MGKINNKAKYPLATNQEISFSDFLIGSLGNGLTRNFLLSTLAAILSETLTVKVELDGASEYQNDDFVDAGFIYGFAMGQEALTGGMVADFNSTTGTVTLADGFTPFTGTVIFVRVSPLT